MSKGLEILTALKKEIKGLKIVEKRGSTFMRFISWLPPFLFFRKRFMEGYITTIGTTIYWPDRPEDFDGDETIKCLLHESVHAADSANPFFELSYLFPQILAVLSVSALSAIWVGVWGLIGLGFLIFLAPWPAPYRVHWEARACAYESLFNYINYGYVGGDWIDNKIEDMFISWDYYKMSWRFNKTRKLLLKYCIKAQGVEKPELILPAKSEVLNIIRK